MTLRHFDTDEEALQYMIDNTANHNVEPGYMIVDGILVVLARVLMKHIEECHQEVEDTE